MAQNNRTNYIKTLTPMIVVFVLLNLMLLMGKTYFLQHNIDYNVILTGNLILFLIGAFTMNRSLKAIDNPNPHVFVRNFYGGFLIRLAVIAVAAFIYIYSQNGNVNKAALFICMGVYAVYSMIEVSTLRKALKEKKNA